MLNFKCELRSPLFEVAATIRELSRAHRRAGVPARESNAYIRNRFHQLTDAQFRESILELKEWARLDQPQRIRGRRL